MQAVPSFVQKCVVFISYKDEQQRLLLAGTGFFVSYPADEPGYHILYLVTARHVIGSIISKPVNNDKVYVQVNTPSGSKIAVETTASQWRYHSDSTVDAAVINWALDVKLFEYVSVSISMAVTKDLIAQYNIGAGDDVFLTGLFWHHYGQKKNLPILRTGSIALISDEKVETNSHYGAMDAYLIEARSIGGLSGSPVFVALGDFRSDGMGNVSLRGAPQYLWLGLMHGHWDVDESSIDVEIDSADRVARNVNMGIGIVVPATKILEIIEQEIFVIERKKINEKTASSRNSIVDSSLEIKN